MNIEEIDKVSTIIRKGGIVILPTETVYGIGCSCFDLDAVKKIYEIKERPYTKPISVLVSNINMVNMVANDISEIEYKVINAFFPGPLTIVLNKNDSIPNILVSNGSTIGVRMADNDLTNTIIEKSGTPLAVSSANESGKKSNININDIYDIFKDKVDYYVDGGISKIGISSTVVKIENNEVIILREGVITKEEIEKVIKGE